MAIDSRDSNSESWRLPDLPERWLCHYIELQCLILRIPMGIRNVGIL